MNAFLGTNILISLFNVVLYAFFRKSYPKEINSMIGYRTKRSMKSQEAWLFANKYASDLMLKSAAVLFILQFLLHLFLQPEVALITFVVVWIMSLFITIFITENALKRNG